MAPLRLPARLEHLKDANEYLRLQTPSAFQCLLPHVLVVAEELLVNVSTYAYAPEHGDVEIECTTAWKDGQEVLCLTIRDWGKAFNQFTIPEPDIRQSVESRSIGGLGIHLVRSLTACQEYRREKDSNIVRVYFSRPVQT
jgi:anti-sigma regulatory factor (Ser/Thr protein kinase)